MTPATRGILLVTAWLMLWQSTGHNGSKLPFPLLLWSLYGRPWGPELN